MCNRLACPQPLFTGKERDAESGNDYFVARYYDSRTGTFSSADPLAGDPNDPQSWNRYPYGRNDPIDITDPSGKSWWSWALEIGIGVAVGWFVPELDAYLAGAGSAGAAAGTTTMTAFYGSQIIGQGSATYAWAAEGATIGGGIGAELKGATDKFKFDNPSTEVRRSALGWNDSYPRNCLAVVCDGRR